MAPTKGDTLENEEKITEEKPREYSLAQKAERMGRLMHRYYTLSARNQGAIGDPLRGQGRVLALLAVKPETTQRELSYVLDMRQQSLSELLAKLEEKGFVTREKSAEDGRVTVVKLTEAGAAAAPSANDMGNQVDALDCLDDEERAQFEELIGKVTASLEEKLTALGDDPSAPPHPMHDERGPQGGRGPRPDRDRDRGFRGERGPREDRGFKGDRGDRPFRGERDGRGFRGERSDRPFRGERDGRGYRGDRGFGGHGGPRGNDGDRRGHNPSDNRMHHA